MKTRAKLYQMEPKASHQHRKRRKLTIPTLPDELITAILERLLVKYLLQFKCVSKNWFALISSPGFVKDHLSFSAKDYTHYVSLLPFRDSMKYCSVGSLFHDTVTETLDLDYPPMTKPYGDVYSSGCVNGLICLYNGFDGLVLWNPWIRKYKEVFGFRPTYLGCRIVDRLSLRMDGFIGLLLEVVMVMVSCLLIWLMRNG
ncbi:hypothetical protein P3S68_021606 [Capsicum galapagoense]